MDVNRDLLTQLYKAAGHYHGALARLARSHRAGCDIETPVQEVIGASLRYRMALDAALAERPSAQARVARLRKVLDCASRQYNLLKRERDYAVRVTAGGTPVPSSRSNSPRTAS